MDVSRLERWWRSRAWASIGVMALSMVIAGCGPQYFVRYDDSPVELPAEKISLETRDIQYLAQTFSKHLQSSRLHRELRGDPSEDATPGVALVDLEFDSNDRDSRPERLDSELATQLFRAEIRYIDRESMNDVLSQLEIQQQDLFDDANRVKLGNFANVHYFLQGKLSVQSNLTQVGRRISEFQLDLELLSLETLVVKFKDTIRFTKIMVK